MLCCLASNGAVADNVPKCVNVEYVAGGLAYLVICWLTPSEVVIVHGREVIMYQGHGVNHLHGTSRWHSLLNGATNQLTGS